MKLYIYDNKFCIVDETKHDSENFNILYFGFYGGTKPLLNLVFSDLLFEKNIVRSLKK